jgi:hypothetical protein
MFISWLVWTPPSKLSQVVMFLSHTSEAIGSDYPDWGFFMFASVFPGKCQDGTSDYAMTTSFHIISNNYSSNHLTVQLFIIWAVNHKYKYTNIHQKLEITVMSMEMLWHFQLQRIITDTYLVAKPQNSRHPPNNLWCSDKNKRPVS